MNQSTRISGAAAVVALLLLASQSAFAGACLIGECNAMTMEFRNLELRPTTIVLLPAQSTLKAKGVFNSKDQVGETAMLEASLAEQLVKQISSRGYEVRFLTTDEINADPQLTTLVNEANARYNEEYAKIVALKVSGVKYRRFSIGEQGRLLANYLDVDAVAYPRMQAVGASGAAMAFSPTGGGQINMEFGLVHARTGDIEAFFGAINQGGLFGKSLDSILEKPDKHMAKIAKTATKKMPKVGAVLKPQKMKEEVGELVLYDPVDEESVLDDLEGLLGDE
jgi:hypothetical protein